MELENRIIAWFEGDLNEVDEKTLLEEVNTSSEAKELFETYQAIYQDFELEEMAKPRADFKKRFQSAVVKDHRLPRFQMMKYAAAVLLLVTLGVLIGLNISKSGQIETINIEMVALQRDMENLLQNESTAQRIRAVKMSNQLEKADPEILRVLIKAMNSDRSENVRMAAIDALENFSHEKIVKEAFLQAFEMQQEEIIQIKLIRILAESRDKTALPYLDKIIENKKTSKYLKTEARQGRKTIVNL